MSRGKWIRKNKGKKQFECECGKQFAYEKSFVTHQAKCNKARNLELVMTAPLPPDFDIRSIVLSLQNRVENLESQLATVQLQLKQKRSYTVRADGDGIPQRDFYSWTQQEFIDAMEPCAAWFHEAWERPLWDEKPKAILCHMLYFMNDKCKLINIDSDSPLDKHGHPLHVDVNFSARWRREVTLISVMKNIAKYDFVPRHEVVEHIFGQFKKG